MEFIDRIFGISNERSFNETAVDIFHYQFLNNPVYRQYVSGIRPDPSEILDFRQIPFLPILFYKTSEVRCNAGAAEKTFLSSGTTSNERSRHPVNDLGVYRESLLRGFKAFYGPPGDFHIIALTPTPDENPDSSLIFMADQWIRHSGSTLSGFYLNDYVHLAELLKKHHDPSRKYLVIGLTYALLDFAEHFQSSPAEMIIMETGGMKGRRKEMIREELYQVLTDKFHVPLIHSEYGMTEMLSQAYSKGNGKFRSPAWMKVLTRDPHDPMTLVPDEKTGCLNIIDLANYNSCSFIATEDLGRTHEDGSFEMLGRFDQSTVRGCNLMIG